MPKKPANKAASARRPARDVSLRKGRMRAADPFELIRWLARSQPDPRKALAELVQNSLDAGASTIRITRQRKAGVTELRIHDDGSGVIPEFSREKALEHLATHIGHSRKRELTPEQRRHLMLQGKYGIGLLGFWSIGRTMEIRTNVPGEPPLLLRLHEDSPEWEIDRIRGRLPFGEARWTEIVIRDLHRQALSSLSARRIADFLGSELRGQLLAHGARVVVHDGIARGLATKFLEVQPRRFEGERLDLPETVDIPGRSALRVELYLLPGGADGGKVAVSQAGTVVYEDIAGFSIADFASPPWTDPRLAGVLDFPDFEVPPGTRRAVVPDEAAAAFVSTVRDLEPMVAALLESAESRTGAEVEATVMRQLERAFREVPKRAPEYDFFEVLDGRRRGFAAGPSPDAPPIDEATTTTDPDADVPSDETPLPGGVAMPPPVDPAETPAHDDTDDDEDDGLLPMAGPLASAVLKPDRTRVEPNGRRRLRLVASDAAGMRIRRPLDVRWSVHAPQGTAPELADAPHTPVTDSPQAPFDADAEPIHADAEPSAAAWIETDRPLTVFVHAGPLEATVRVVAEVREDQRMCTATAVVEIVAADAGEQPARTGIPEPVFLDEPASEWRSRIADHRWEVNSGHPDFVDACDTNRRKLRYLATLLAKEVVLHSFPAPQVAQPLERMVEVLSIIEKKLERS